MPEAPDLTSGPVVPTPVTTTDVALEPTTATGDEPDRREPTTPTADLVLRSEPQYRLYAYVLDGLLFAVTFGMGWLVWSLVLWRQGTTPGKHLLGMRVVRTADGAPAGFAQMLVRELLFKGLLGSVTAGITTIAGGLMIYRRPREALWDKFASTAVVDTRPHRKGWGVGFWLAITWIVLVAVVILLVPVLPLEDPNRSSRHLFSGPLADGFLFGSDELGRDLFSRVLWGLRASMAIGVVSLVCGFVIGGFLGITAGFFRGRYEKAVMAVVDIMLSFPALILALGLLRALSEPGTLEGSFGKVVIVLTVLSVPALARITRANTLVYSQREFVLAARSLGARPWRILVKEILPNVLPSMLSFSFVALAILVIAEGSLAFLGLSVEAPNVTLGKLIELGRGDLDKAPNLALIPCAFLFVTLVALNFIGDKLQARYSVREANV